MWNHLVRKSHDPDPCPSVPLIPAFQEPPSSLPEAPKPVSIQNLLGRNETTVCFLHWNNTDDHTYLLCQVWNSCSSFPPTYPMPTVLELLWNTIWEKSSLQIFKVPIHKKAKTPSHKNTLPGIWQIFGRWRYPGKHSSTPPKHLLVLPHFLPRSILTRLHGKQWERKRTKWPSRDTCEMLTLAAFSPAQRGEQRTMWSRVKPSGCGSTGLTALYPMQSWDVWLLSAGRYQGDWASQAWSASCEGYIPQKVKAQIKPLCKMSTVPAEVLWNLSAVLAYVGHLEIKWNRNNCGQRKSPSCSQPCVTDPMIASATWNIRFTHEKPHVWLFSWSNQLWGLQGLCQQLPFAGTLSMMEINPSTMETGLKLPWFRCPKKNPTSEHAGIITAISLLLRGLPNSCPSGSPASPPLLPPSPKYPAMHITS